MSEAEMADASVAMWREIDRIEAEITKLRHDLRSALAAPWKISLKGVLPRKVRLRLWLAHQVNGAAIWLAYHHHERLAVSLWRVCGMW